MSKRILFIMFALLSVVAFSNKALANSDVDLNTLSETKEISGILTRVYMNGEKQTGQEVTATVTDNGNRTIDLTLEKFKVGSMPGYISAEAYDIPIKLGNFNVPVVYDAVKLKIIGTSSFDASVVGTYNDGNLNFTVHTVDAKYLGIPFEAIVTFQSK